MLYQSNFIRSMLNYRFSILIRTVNSSVTKFLQKLFKIYSTILKSLNDMLFKIIKCNIVNNLNNNINNDISTAMIHIYFTRTICNTLL